MSHLAAPFHLPLDYFRLSSRVDISFCFSFDLSNEHPFKFLLKILSWRLDGTWFCKKNPYFGVGCIFIFFNSSFSLNISMGYLMFSPKFLVGSRVCFKNSNFLSNFFRSEPSGKTVGSFEVSTCRSAAANSRERAEKEFTIRWRPTLTSRPSASRSIMTSERIRMN